MIARRANGLPVIGGDILEYRDNKVRTVADAGIFDQAAASTRSSPTASRTGDWATRTFSRDSSARNFGGAPHHEVVAIRSKAGLDGH